MGCREGDVEHSGSLLFVLFALGWLVISRRCVTLDALMHVYEVRPRKDRRGVDLISDALPFGGLWYAGPNAVANAIGYAEHRSRSHDAVIRVYDESWQPRRNARARGRFQRALAQFVLRRLARSFTDCSELFSVQVCRVALYRS